MKLSTILLATGLLGLSSQVLAERDYHEEYAKVIESRPVIRMVERVDYERQCQPRVVRYQERRSNGSDRFFGSVVGAAIGHALGHNSKHRTGATIAGAIIGSNIAGDNHRTARSNERLENQCFMQPVTWEEEQVIGYDVVYRYNGRKYETRLPYEPGKRLKIRIQVLPVDMGRDY